MCYFITIGIPKGRSGDLKASVPRGMRVDPSRNQSIASEMGGDYDLFILTSNGCSCDMYWPFDKDGHDEGQRELVQLRKKYAKKGWSEAKISRAIGTRTTLRRQDFVGLRDDVRSILSAVADALGRIGIVVHYYDGRIDEESVLLCGSSSLTAVTLRKRGQTIAEDTLTWVRADA